LIITFKKIKLSRSGIFHFNFEELSCLIFEFGNNIPGCIWLKSIAFAGLKNKLALRIIKL